MTLKVFESKKIERSTNETINYKLEWLMIVFLSLVFTVICRVSQYSEIERVFVIKTDAGAFRFQMLMIASFLVLWIFFGFVLWIIFELGRWKHESCVRFIKFFLLYFSIQCVVLFLVWPGIFKQDELYLLFFTIDNIQVKWEQSLYTQIFYWLSIAMFPYVVSLTFFQIVLISIFAGNTIKTVWNYSKNKKLAFILFVPFLLLPVLDNNQFNMRNSQISWLLMFLFVNLYYEYQKMHFIRLKNACIYLFISIFIGFWKTEFIYLLPCIFIIILLADFRKYQFKVFGLIPIMLGILGIFILPNKIWKPQDNSYVMTAVLTPLSDIVTTHYGKYDDSIKDDINVINDWIPIDDIKKTTTFYGTPLVYWEKGKIEDKQQTKKLLKASFNIFMNYRTDFLKNRIEVYKMTNGFVPNVVNHGNVIYWKNILDIDGEDFYNYYFRYTNLGHSEVRNKVITFLACRSQKNYIKTNILYPILYNSFYGLVLLFIIMIFELMRKKWVEVCIYGTVIMQVPLIILFAPSHMFMYYMPFYLTSLTLIFCKLIGWIDQRLVNRIK